MAPLSSRPMYDSFEDAIQALFGDRFALATDRLILDRIKDGDLEDVWEIFGNDHVTRDTDFRTRESLEDSRKVLDYFLGCYGSGEQYRFAIRDRESLRMMGSIGLFGFEEESRLAEIGYELKESHWKRGYMTEAIGAIERMFFLEMGGHRLEAIVTPGNGASSAVLARCGFLREGCFRKRDFFKGEYWDGEIFAILAEDHRSGTAET